MTRTPERLHKCAAYGCDLDIPPRLYACLAHWSSLPFDMRRDLLREYRHGQERTGKVSRAYVDATRRAIRYLAKKEKKELPEPYRIWLDGAPE